MALADSHGTVIAKGQRPLTCFLDIFMQFASLPVYLIAAALLQLVLSSSILGREAVNSICDESTILCRRQGMWFVADTLNFQVCTTRSEREARVVAIHCEKMRAAFARTWDTQLTSWNQRCQVILYSSTSEYVRAVGKGSESTLGSSLVKPSMGKVASRRIDLRGNVEDVLTAALPHELCHVMLADEFRDAPAPLWFDEGVAILYDSATKQVLHERDLQLGLTRGLGFGLSELLSLTEYPSAERWGVFYGQSLSLVRSLLSQGSPGSALLWVKRCPEVGINIALRETYGLRGIQDLELVWRKGVQPHSIQSGKTGQFTAVSTQVNFVNFVRTRGGR